MSFADTCKDRKTDLAFQVNTRQLPVSRKVFLGPRWNTLD